MTPTSQDRADFRAVMHGAGIFQLYEGLFIGLITAEEMADEMERRKVVRTYPGRIYWLTAETLAFCALAAILGANGSVLLWSSALSLAVYTGLDVVRFALAWRRARRPAVGP